MNRNIQLTVILEKEENEFVALCPELDIASQGETANVAKSNLQEALELFFQTASKLEIAKRLPYLGIDKP